MEHESPISLKNKFFFSVESNKFSCTKYFPIKTKMISSPLNRMFNWRRKVNKLTRQVLRFPHLNFCISSSKFVPLVHYTWVITISNYENWLKGVEMAKACWITFPGYGKNFIFQNIFLLVLFTTRFLEQNANEIRDFTDPLSAASTRRSPA